MVPPCNQITDQKQLAVHQKVFTSSFLAFSIPNYSVIYAHNGCHRLTVAITQPFSRNWCVKNVFNWVWGASPHRPCLGSLQIVSSCYRLRENLWKFPVISNVTQGSNRHVMKCSFYNFLVRCYFWSVISQKRKGPWLRYLTSCLATTPYTPSVKIYGNLSALRPNQTFAIEHWPEYAQLELWPQTCLPLVSCKIQQLTSWHLIWAITVWRE